MARHRKAGGQGRHWAQATTLTTNREAIEYELHYAPPITLRSPELGGKGRASATCGEVFPGDLSGPPMHCTQAEQHAGAHDAAGMRWLTPTQRKGRWCTDRHAPAGRFTFARVRWHPAPRANL